MLAMFHCLHAWVMISWPPWPQCMAPEITRTCSASFKPSNSSWSENTVSLGLKCGAAQKPRGGQHLVNFNDSKQLHYQLLTNHSQPIPILQDERARTVTKARLSLTELPGVWLLQGMSCHKLRYIYAIRLIHIHMHLHIHLHIHRHILYTDRDLYYTYTFTYTFTYTYTYTYTYGY